jgi:hypothetical protein
MNISFNLTAQDPFKGMDYNEVIRNFCGQISRLYFWLPLINVGLLFAPMLVNRYVKNVHIRHAVEVMSFMLCVNFNIILFLSSIRWKLSKRLNSYWKARQTCSTSLWGLSRRTQNSRKRTTISIWKISCWIKN